MTLNTDQQRHSPAEATQEKQGANARTWTPAQRQRSRRKAAFLRALHEHGSISAACLASGVHDTTVWRWRKEYPAFDTAVLNFTEGVREQRVIESLYKIATSEDPKMANAAAKAGAFLLQAWNRPKYSPHLKIEQTVSVHQQVQVALDVRDQIRAVQAERLSRIHEHRTLEG
ncbi:hypothetical protein GCM10022631_41740 [Deinococcus rubellus]|uniref:helix-turn-helix domain-containing protein n=1 Tax=Deinococcus rubellus TaxID=1889240 RepID=UPI0031E592AE